MPSRKKKEKQNVGKRRAHWSVKSKKKKKNLSMFSAESICGPNLIICMILQGKVQF